MHLPRICVTTTISCMSILWVHYIGGKAHLLQVLILIRHTIWLLLLLLQSKDMLMRALLMIIILLLILLLLLLKVRLLRILLLLVLLLSVLLLISLLLLTVLLLKPMLLLAKAISCMAYSGGCCCSCWVNTCRSRLLLPRKVSIICYNWSSNR